MAVDILFFGGFKDGEILLDSAYAISTPAPYVGGQPACLTPTGARLSLTPDIIGVFKNSSVEDLKGDVQVAETLPAGTIMTTVIWGDNKLKFFKEGAEAKPFKDTPTTGGTYIVNQGLYVDTDGLWDNAAAVADDTPSFKVIAVIGEPATPDALEVYGFAAGIPSIA